jgi:hypothetical protein
MLAACSASSFVDNTRNGQATDGGEAGAAGISPGDASGDTASGGTSAGSGGSTPSGGADTGGSGGASSGTGGASTGGAGGGAADGSGGAGNGASDAPACSTPVLVPLVNPSFETELVSIPHGTKSFHGWVGENYRWNSNGVSDGGATDGARKYYILGGGRLETSADARPAVLENNIYVLEFDTRKTKDDYPDDWWGLEAYLSFYGQDGGLIRELRSLPIHPATVTSDYSRVSFQHRAPSGARSVGIRLVLPHHWPHEDARNVDIDNVALWHWPETGDHVRVLAAPSLLEPGRTQTIRVKYVASQAGDVTVELRRGSAVVATANQAVTSGRDYIDVAVGVPGGLANGEDYSWSIALRSAQASAVARVDQSVSGSGSVPADHPALLYSGRIDQSDPKKPTIDWQGSSVATRFEGTKAIATFSNGGSSVDLVVAVDGLPPLRVNVPAWANQQKILLASSLESGVHTLTIMRVNEPTGGLVFHGLELDAGKGLLLAAPPSPLKVEVYGDSVTSGGTSEPKPGVAAPRYDNDEDWVTNPYFGYGAELGRGLHADFRLVSKGATGVARSFVFNYTARDYYNLLKFNIYDPTSASSNSPWDFSKWQADVVIINYGQNDAGRGTPWPEFITAYVDFLGKLRVAYPSAALVCTIGEMSSGIGLRQAIDQAVRQFRATTSDERVFFTVLWNDGTIGGSHPHDLQHHNMAFGSTVHEGLVDFITREVLDPDPPCRK